MSINETLNKNMELAVRTIEEQKKAIKLKKDEKVRAETRIEENEKGLQKDYDEIEAMGFSPDNISETLASFDKSLEDLNNQILDCLQKING